MRVLFGYTESTDSIWHCAVWFLTLSTAAAAVSLLACSYKWVFATPGKACLTAPWNICQVLPWWPSGRRWHTQHVLDLQAVLGSDACSPSPSPVKGTESIIIIILYTVQKLHSKVCFHCCKGIYFWFSLSNLSEVTLFNVNCPCKWNHVAAFGLIGRKVWYSYVWLRHKRNTAEDSASMMLVTMSDRIYRILQILWEQYNV